MQRAESLTPIYAELELTLYADKEKNTAVLRARAQGKIFGTQPFFCFKTTTGKYYWDNLDYGENKREWSYVFDDKTFNLNVIEQVAIAANTPEGMTEIVIYNVTEDKKEHYYLENTVMKCR